MTRTLFEPIFYINGPTEKSNTKTRCPKTFVKFKKYSNYV